MSSTQNQSNTLPTAAENFAAIQRDVHEAVRQLQLGRAISYARPGSVSVRLPGNDRLALTALDSAAAPEARFVAVVGADAPASDEATPATLRDAAAIHRAILEAKPTAKVALLFRGRHLTGWAAASQPIPVRYFQMFNYTKASEIPTAKVATPGDVSGLRRTLAANPDAPAVLLSTGDVLIWGRSVLAVARLALGLEEAAQVTAIADRLGGAKAYPPGIGESIYAALAANS